MAESAGEFEMGCMEMRESCLALADQDSGDLTWISTD